MPAEEEEASERWWTWTSLLTMTRFGLIRISSLIRCLRPISQNYFGFLGRLIHRFFTQLTELLRLAIGRRDDGEGPADSESNGTRALRFWRKPGPQHQTRDGREHDEVDPEAFRVDESDELYCNYDSTWHDESEDEDEEQRATMRTRRPAKPRYSKFGRFEQAARDMQNYRRDYPGRVTDLHQDPQGDKPNLEFYLGMKQCLPDGLYIQDFHNDWHAKHDALEHVHTYIQWLFPLQEPGMNSQATVLTKEEIQDFLNNSTAHENLRKSYKLMLDFYGITLCNKETGEVQRASNWKIRFDNLNSNTHNNLRITRILKCLGTLGYAHYQFPLVHFFLNETLVKGELPRVKESVLNYFVFAVRDKKERRRLLKFAYSHYPPTEEFVWCPKKIQMMWSRHRDGFNVERNPKQMREKTVRAESASYII